MNAVACKKVWYSFIYTAWQGNRVTWDKGERRDQCPLLEQLSEVEHQMSLSTYCSLLFSRLLFVEIIWINRFIFVFWPIYSRTPEKTDGVITGDKYSPARWTSCFATIKHYLSPLLINKENRFLCFESCSTWIVKTYHLWLKSDEHCWVQNRGPRGFLVKRSKLLTQVKCCQWAEFCYSDWKNSLVVSKVLRANSTRRSKPTPKLLRRLIGDVLPKGAGGLISLNLRGTRVTRETK
jgi:hypothetical protein